MLANQSAPSLNEQWPEAPFALSDIVAKLLARDPAHRFQSANEVADALLPFCQDDGLPELLPERSTDQFDSSELFAGDSVACTLEDTLILDRLRDPQVALSTDKAEEQRTTALSGKARRLNQPWVRIGLLLFFTSSLTALLVSRWNSPIESSQSSVAKPDSSSVRGEQRPEREGGSVSSSANAAADLSSTVRLSVDAALAEIANTDDASSMQWTVFGSDTTPDDRADAIHTARNVVPVSILLNQYQVEKRPTVRAGLLLAISAYDREEVISAAGSLFGGLGWRWRL